MLGAPFSTQTNERGAALIYILLAIGLLAALTANLMQPSSQQASSQGSFKAVSGLDTQIHLIRSSIQQCVLTYPRGDSAITDIAANTIYPINPNSSYYSSATPGQSGDRLVRNIRCPGDNAGGGANHGQLFSGSTGRFLPPAPALFEDWQIYNGADGVFFWTQTDKSDSYIQSALEKLDEKYSECEADVIDASGGARNLDSNGVVSCASGYTCFRIFMIANASAVYNGDTDGDEASCP